MDIDALLQPPAVPLVQAARSEPAWHRQPWWWRLGQWLSAYLPLLAMAVLALATWWLVQNTPRPEAPREAVAARHEPDYTMQGFTLERFDADGRARVQVRGTLLRHYPDTDTLEIDGVTIRATSADGSVTHATARRAISNGDASEVQLLGAAQVVREAFGNSPRVEFDSEYLHALFNIEQLRSHLPVRLRQGGSELRVGAIEYDNLARSAKLGAPVRARFDPPRR